MTAIALPKLNSLPDDTEFILAELLGEQIDRDQMRLTFYRKIRQIDEKRVEIVLFGCTQTVLDDPGFKHSVALPTEEVKQFVLGRRWLRPRYNNLDDRSTRPTSMSGQYGAHVHGDGAQAMRRFYTHINKGDSFAISFLPRDEDAV
jgi:hypothetical protein